MTNSNNTLRIAFIHFSPCPVFESFKLNCKLGKYWVLWTWESLQGNAGFDLVHSNFFLYTFNVRTLLVAQHLKNCPCESQERSKKIGLLIGDHTYINIYNHLIHLHFLSNLTVWSKSFIACVCLMYLAAAELWGEFPSSVCAVLSDQRFLKAAVKGWQSRSIPQFRPSDSGDKLQLSKTVLYVYQSARGKWFSAREREQCAVQCSSVQYSVALR